MSIQQKDTAYKSNFKTFNNLGFRLVDRVFSELPEVKDKAVILVSHSMFTGLPAIKAAERIAGKGNLHLVLKNSSDNKDFREFLESKGYNILDLKKEDFKKNPERVISELSKVSNHGKMELLFLDHGGYGAYHLSDLAKELNFAGIVEYALNGKTRYLDKGISEANIPFASIAESLIKLDPDYSCGRLIGQMTASEAQRHSGYGIHLRGFVQAGVIGFGKLGSKAAEALVRNGAHNVMIYDKDPAKMIHASGEGFNVSPRSTENLISECNVIIVGTDNAPIQPNMYHQMPQDTIIASVTSPDDTLDLEGLIADKVLKKRRESGRIHTYEVGKGSGKFVHLIAGGDAPNLKDSPFGVNDPTLFMPLILHARIGRELIETRVISAERMQQIEVGVQSSYLDVYQQLITSPRRSVINSTGI